MLFLLRGPFVSDSLNTLKITSENQRAQITSIQPVVKSNHFVETNENLKLKTKILIAFPAVVVTVNCSFKL